MAVNRLEGQTAQPAQAPVEVSIVMPCLNEAATLESCIRKAKLAIARHQLAAEIIVADNGSTDASPTIARALGARLVTVRQRGYGAALQAGIAAAQGQYVVMGDADDSYDFSGIGDFVTRLRLGSDLVMGNRFKGGIDAGAMPWTHRFIGNPILTAIGRFFFGVRIGDFHCGLRAFRKDAYERMDLRTTGMEFASEMVIKAGLKRMRIDEVPTVLHKDGRGRPPHLRTWRDGWRHLRFMLLFSPRWLFIAPGASLFLAGVLVSAWLVGGPRVLGRFGLDIDTLLVSAFACLLGFQLLVFGVFTKVFAIREGFHPPHTAISWLFRYITLEVGLLCGALLTLAGVIGLIVAFLSWQAVGFGALDPRVSMRELIPAVVMMALGVQTIFASFFLSILDINAKRSVR
jgi:glycosyltransferase involved in cell wall biosynthesis